MNNQSFNIKNFCICLNFGKAITVEGKARSQLNFFIVSENKLINGFSKAQDVAMELAILEYFSLSNSDLIPCFALHLYSYNTGQVLPKIINCGISFIRRLAYRFYFLHYPHTRGRKRNDLSFWYAKNFDFAPDFTRAGNCAQT